jgi:uncharacterized membrane protein
MVMNRQEMKLKARDVIKGKVLMAFCIIAIFGVIVSIPNVILDSIFSAIDGTAAAVIGVLVAIASVLLMPMKYAVVLYFHNISNGRDGKVKVEDFLIPYKEKFATEMLKAQIMREIYMLVGFICLVVPGIYMYYKYSQIEYVYLENTKTQYKDALARSAQIMKGNVLELFVLDLSFIVWHLLAALTFGILYVYVLPYIEAAKIQFYYTKSGYDFNKVEEVVSVNPADITESNDEEGK